MPSIIELMRQRKAAKEIVKSREPMVRVLLALGLSLVFIVLTVVAFAPRANLSPILTMAVAMGAFVLFIYLARKNRAVSSKEQERSRLRLKSVFWSVLLLVLLLIVIIYCFSFFIWLSSYYPFVIVGTKIQDLLAITQTAAIVIFFASTPFIMALWYKTAPVVSSKLILRLFKAFNRKSKTKIMEVMVIDTPQDHSFYISLKRAVTAVIYSFTTVYTIWIPLAHIIGPYLPASWLYTIVESSDVKRIDSDLFVHYCNTSIINIVIPLVLTFVFFFWALPSTYLLDDAGVVFYRRYTRRRQPLQIGTISFWFISIVKAVLGTSALFSYYFYVADNVGILNIVKQDILLKFGPLIGDQAAQSLATTSAVQFGIFLFGFPLLGTILMALILLLFQESNFNKLKSFLYQELVNLKIDPRLVKVSVERVNEFQDNTYIDYVGENFFHNPPLKDSIQKIPPPGEIDPNDK
ncbi:MAG TPA: hypothetical protein VKM55_07085 [Candidatus Lokiarchaeia archaeon]|nr:hypothetical protein [Candidatus Lokiarchaeia archaeon]